MTPIRNGLIHGMPMDEYQAEDAVSNSRLSDLVKSPAHCYALHLDPNRPEREAREWMLTGPLAHCAVLEPDAMTSRYLVVPDDAPKRPTEAQWNAKNPNEGSKAAMAWWRDFNAQVGDREIVSAAQFSTVQGQIDAVRAVPMLVDMLSAGKPEASVFWTDEVTGLRCRARPDWLQPPANGKVDVLDLKTIADLTTDTVSRAIASHGYHRQAAHYRNGLRACGFSVGEFVFGFVSKTYPYLAAAFVLDEETMQQGEDEVAELLELYAQCHRSGRWPGPGESLQLVGLPAWAKRSSEIEVSFAS